MSNSDVLGDMQSVQKKLLSSSLTTDTSCALESCAFVRELKRLANEGRQIAETGTTPDAEVWSSARGKCSLHEASHGTPVARQRLRVNTVLSRGLRDQT